MMDGNIANARLIAAAALIAEQAAEIERLKRFFESKSAKSFYVAWKEADERAEAAARALADLLQVVEGPKLNDEKYSYKAVQAARVILGITPGKSDVPE
jgi:hypothetical protein